MKRFQLKVSVVTFLSVLIITEERKVEVLSGRWKRVLMDVDRDVIKLHVSSTMDCMSQCHRRKRCKLFRAKLTVLGINKCSLDMTAGEGTDYNSRKDSCMEKVDLIYKYPKVLAGACSEHSCNASQVCQPMAEGGYKCDTERNTREEKRRRKLKGKSSH